MPVRDRAYGVSVMLNKEVCRRCRNEPAHKQQFESWEYNHGNWYWWTGVLHCPHVLGPDGTIHIMRNISTLGDPPEHCNYITEHMVSQDVE